MPAPQTLQAAGGKPASANAKPSDRSTDAFSRQMRSEIALLSIIVLLIFVVSIIFEAGDWLELVLQYQAYHIDEIIVAVFAISFVMTVFLIRGWRDVRKEAAARAVAVKQIEQRSGINAQLSQMTSLLHACFELGKPAPSFPILPGSSFLITRVLCMSSAAPGTFWK